ncbi:beta-lactamase domain-containing protein [Penicillium brevicompactum]|uniref:beta-lactamase domain-containing protein n=1 Tax=Penicillium brevicompactum TaxID=5074 RepID=UPI002542227C|nr:beta-lactamase domain-containing protein [Penicillium brevicompactum]KAJ5344191.1 beta-lactamase domain-containing protein [Penicillium brevicompactum]
MPSLQYMLSKKLGEPQAFNEGKLQGDEPITKYLPELSSLPGPMPADQLTLIDILSHQTGLPGLDALWLGADNEINIPEEFTLAMCKHLPALYPPRSKWLYNNWMYALAGKIIGQAANVSWGQASESHVLGPVGLTQSSVIESKIPAGSTALPYAVLDDKTKRRIGDVRLTDGSLMSPAGGVRSTLHDLLSCGDALLSSLQGEVSPLRQLDSILFGHSFINKSASFDELYGLGFAKVTLPAQFGKIRFNPGLVNAMPVIGSKSDHQLVFYHNGAIPSYNHCIMLLPSEQIAIVVLTNSISQGDIADWVAQTLLQVVLRLETKTDIVSLAQQTAKKWRSGYHNFVETLEKEKIPNTIPPPNEDLTGTYVHSPSAFLFKVFMDDGLLKFNINGKKSQTHMLTHYHNDTISFLPSAEERMKRGLFHYGTHAWLLHFKRNDQGAIKELSWVIDDNIKEGEVFTRV